MSEQKIFFKEHIKEELFGKKGSAYSEYLNLFKVKLLTVSNNFGFMAVGFENELKIFGINQMISNDWKSNPVASVKLDASFKLAYVELNCADTILYALYFRQNGNTFEYFLNVYDMETIILDKLAQTPTCIQTFNLENDNSYVTDVSISPSELDLLALSKSNGKCVLLSKLLSKSCKVISKDFDASCICWSPKGKQLAICTKQNNLILCNHELEIKSNYTNVMNQNLNPTSIYWISKKKFLLSYVNQEERSEFYSLEVIADKTTQTEQINRNELGSLAYDVADYKVSVLYFSQISEWFVLYNEPYF